MAVNGKKSKTKKLQMALMVVILMTSLSIILVLVVHTSRYCQLLCGAILKYLSTQYCQYPCVTTCGAYLSVFVWHGTCQSIVCRISRVLRQASSWGFEFFAPFEKVTRSGMVTMKMMNMTMKMKMMTKKMMTMTMKTRDTCLVTGVQGLQTAP